MKEHYADERLLMEHVKLGEVPAFTFLYNHYHPYLYHFSLRYLKSADLAEETVHDVFLKVWEHREQLNSELSLKGLLIRICKNHILNILSRASREQTLLAEILQSSDAGHSDTERAILHADFERHAMNVIGYLPPQRQKIFRMYRFDEMDQEQIARTLGISKGTVKDHLLKANRFIRKYVHSYLDIPADLPF
jgi:RNA polymerase sigma-70 factor (ECF subfamily)